MALTAADKKVIDAFTDGTTDIPEGPKSAFYARGGTLYGPANSKLARLKYEWVTWIGTGGTKYQDDTYRYLKKTVPAKRFKGHGAVEGTTPNSKSSMGFVVDAKTQDFLRPANRSDMLKSLQSPTGEFSEGGRRVLVRNGVTPKSYPRPPRPKQAPILIPERKRHGGGKTFPSLQSFVQSSVKSQTGAGDLRRMQAEYEEERYPWRSDLRPNSSTSEEDWGSEEILRGMVLGFWLQGWAAAMEEAGLRTPKNITEETAPEPPEELTDFGMAFANRLLDLNGGMDLFQLSKKVGVKASEREEFGYYLAMESLGHGVAWSDDHEDHGLKIPDTEVGFSLEDPDDENSTQLDYAAVASR